MTSVLLFKRVRLNILFIIVAVKLFRMILLVKVKGKAGIRSVVVDKYIYLNRVRVSKN